jgi:uncharacterized membrane protein
MTTIITISIIALILILGQVLEAVLEPFYEKRPWIKQLMSVYPTPFNIMRLYARVGDTEGFTRTHAMTGFAFFAIMAVVGFFAWWADQQVLYGLEYVASRDKNSAYIQSVGIATIIQAMLVFNGGMAVKIWINDLRKNPDHEIQFRINTFLFLVAFASTLALSFMTYYVAKAKGIEAERIVKQEISGETTAELNGFDTEIKRWEMMLRRDSTAVQTSFVAAVETVEKQTGTYKVLKEAQTKQGTVTKEAASARVSSMDIWGNTEIRKLAAKRDKEMSAVLAKYNPHIEQLQKKRSEVVVNTVQEKETAEDGLTLDIATNAEATMGKNLILNLIAFFFNLGLQFFVRGANKENPKKKTNNGNGNNSNSGFGSGGGGNNNSNSGSSFNRTNWNSGSSGGGNNGNGNGDKLEEELQNIEDDLDNLDNDFDDLETQDTIDTETIMPEKNIDIPYEKEQKDTSVLIDDEVAKLKKRAQQQKSGGGSLEINAELNHKILPDGDVVVLYKGKARDEWWNWNQYMYSTKNRINKFVKVSAPEAKENQLEWIRLFESRMDFIEKMRVGKPLPKRIEFDPNNPTKKIFGV